MNNNELTARVSQLSGIDEETCRTVLNAFEEALAEGFSQKSWKTKALASVSRVLDNIREKQETN